MTGLACTDNRLSAPDPTQTSGAPRATAPAASVTPEPEEEHPPVDEEAILHLNDRVCPLDGRIAYITSKDGNSEVYVKNADGSGEINLSNQLTNDLGPIWSPECEWVAYSSDRNWFPENTFEIFVAASDGSGEYLLLPAAADRCCQDYARAWSPDGQLIAITGAIYHLYLVRPDGSGLTWIAFGNSPQWSPDSSKLSYRHPIGNTPTDLFEVNIDGSDRKLLQVGSQPSPECFQDVLSPDGTKRACMTTRDGWNQEIYVIDVSTGADLNVSDDLSAAETEPAWAPDSKRLAFASDRNGVFEIFIVNSDGTGLERLTRAPCPGGPTCSGHQDPSWSADGTTISFSFGHDGFDERCEVRVADGRTTCIPPTPTPEPCTPAEITPDGRIVRCR